MWFCKEYNKINFKYRWEIRTKEKISNSSFAIHLRKNLFLISPSNLISFHWCNFFLTNWTFHSFPIHSFLVHPVFHFDALLLKKTGRWCQGTVTCFPNWVLDFIRSRGRANLSKFKTSDCYSIEIGQIAINWNFLLPNFNSIWEMSMIIWPRSLHKVTLSQSLQFR